jgi:uncharacterized protein
MTMSKLSVILMFLALVPARALAGQDSLENSSAAQQFHAPGIAAVLLNLGDLHRKGSIRSRDGEFALNYYLKKATAAGEVYSVIRPADLINVQAGISAPDAIRAQEAYELAAEFGSPDAYLRLSGLFLNSVPPDASRAFEMVGMAEQLGSREAPVKLGLMMIRGAGVERDVEGGLQLLNVSADLGNQRAIMELGLIYQHGLPNAVEADPARAFNLFRKAADLGSVGAAVICARMTIYGEGVPAEPGKGLAVAQALARAGEPGAYVLIGDVSAKGVLGFKSRDEIAAFAAYSKAGELGSQTGMVRTAVSMISGTGTQRDVQSGLDLLEDTAARSNESALIKLADFYGDPAMSAERANAEKAHQYAMAAARMGSTRGKLMAAKFALENNFDGVAVSDGVKALGNLEAQGEAQASLILAEYYSGGFRNSPAVDQNKTFRHLLKAADAGSKSGLLRASLMQVRGEGTEQNFADGLETLRGLADEGQVDALIAIGDLHASGQKGTSNFDHAKEAYEAAAELGSQYAYIRLGDLYRTMSPDDPDRAAAYYLKAAGLSGASHVPATN